MDQGKLLESDMLQLISRCLTADFFIQGLSAIDEVHMDYEFEI